MKKLIPLIMLIALSTVAIAQVRLSTYYNYPLLSGATYMDSVLNGLKSIRGCWFDSDLDNDGKSEILVTNYNDLGHVHVFEVVGNDSIELVWTSPKVASGGGSSTPRYVITGDLDNDGKKEIIFQSNNNGIFIFEWDGVPGSNNFGTLPSQVINSTTLPQMTGISGNTEYMEIGDPDRDNQNELLVFYNSNPNSNDKFYIISAIGDWSTNDPGFSGFQAEYSKSRIDLATWDMNLGTPYSMHIANFDGQGNPELLFQAWNYKAVTPLRVPAANTYVEADTTTGKQSLRLSNADDVALFGGGTFDIDRDGREEVYLPNYHSTGSNFIGTIHVIHYPPGSSTSRIDTNNVFVLRFVEAGVLDPGLVTFGFGYGDIDKDGKPNIYTSSTYGITGCNLLTAEFQGGDKTNPANWTFEKLYPGDPTIYTQRVIRDSLGLIDTVFTIDNSFPSKIFGRYTDIDKDGFEDIILPYQALVDSVIHKRIQWNASQGQWVTVDSVRAPNPKRWGLRVVEGTKKTGVEVKDLTIITPDDYQLYQNYPNPFNPSTKISFYLPIEKKISLKIYNQLGQLVKTLIDNQLYDKGNHSIIWDGRNDAGKLVTSGIYIAQLQFGNFSKEIKMMLVK
ncbi:MAG: FG-GAP-like repeat-containing protein [Ignavibacteria bacterium]|nr:FG-GAP-like repeat-containing protein [Ignavibacteria bacterium]